MTMHLERFRQCGVTLVELMVAMVLGMLVAAGIITVFSSTSSNNKAQNQLARLQEEGRFAIQKLASDLSMANGLYCSNTGGEARQTAGGLYLDHVLAPVVYAKNLIDGAGAASGALADVTTAWGTSAGGGGHYPAMPLVPYAMPSFLFMRGYDCTISACAPLDPVAAGLPEQGSRLGDRVGGSDVLTLRYLNPSSGWAIGRPNGSVIVPAPHLGEIHSIEINPGPGEPPRTHFANGDLAMLADCSGAQIFAASYAPSDGVLTLSGANNFSGSGPVEPSAQSAPMLYDVNRDFQTVTYYLKVVSVNNDDKPPYTGALMRRVNGGIGPGGVPRRPGGSEDEMVRGAERLDFKYSVEDADGNTSFLTAGQVDAARNCPPMEVDAITRAGCMWRAVKGIEVSILMDGQAPLYSLSPDDMRYAYTVDGIYQPAAPGAHEINPRSQGFVDHMLRREFTALIALRNYNP